jgi:hypothetical protein
MSKFAAAAIPAVYKTGELPHNWDGHYSDAPPAAARQAASEFLQRLDHKLGSKVPEPSVGAVGDGVMLLWRSKPRPGIELAIIFYEGGNEWSISDRKGKEARRHGQDSDPEALFRIVNETVAT